MGVASGSGWNLWVWLVVVVVRRYIDFLILLIPTPLVAASLLFVHYIINSNQKSECNLKMPSLLYTQWHIATMCGMYKLYVGIWNTYI